MSAKGDNNAVMAQLLLLGTNFVNFMGRFVYVATGEDGVEAVRSPRWTSRRRSSAATSTSSRIPSGSRSTRSAGGELTTSVHHGSTNALRRAGARRISSTSPTARAASRCSTSRRSIRRASPRRSSARRCRRSARTPTCETRHATAVAAPSTLAVDPARCGSPENEEQPIHPLYAYIYIADREEGLVLSTAATLLDGNPSQQLPAARRGLQSGGPAEGRRNLAIAGNYAYICAIADW